MALVTLETSLLLGALGVLALVLRRRKAGRWLAAATVTTLASGIIAALIAVEDARRQMIADLFSPPEGVKKISPWVVAFSQTEVLLRILGTALLGGALLLGVASVAFLWRRPRARLDGRSWFGVFSALALGATALGILLPSPESLAVFSGPHYPIEHERAAIARYLENAPVTQARLHLLAIAGLGTAFVGVRMLRDRRLPSSPFITRERVASVLLFALGLASFLGTRAYAHDGRFPLLHPTEAEKRNPFREMERGFADALPSSLRCDAPVEEGLSLAIGEGWAVFYTERVADAREFTQALARRHMIRRGSDGLPTSPVLIGAEAERDTRAIAPYLRALQTCESTAIRLVTVRLPAPMTSATLGALPRSPRYCQVPLRLDAAGTPLARYATWGELVRDVEAGLVDTIAP